MSSGTMIVFNKEWRNFVGSDRSAFLVYIILVVSWGVLLATSKGQEFSTGPLWLVFFSVIISANFCNTVFIAERTSGSLEILITSGLSRGAILYGKMLFIIMMTLLIGGICGFISWILSVTALRSVDTNHELITIENALLYIAATMVNSSSSAYFSVRLSSPRLLYFVNLFLLGTIMTIYTVLNAYYETSSTIFLIILFGLGIFFTWLAYREFNSERIVRPIIM